MIKFPILHDSSSKQQQSIKYIISSDRLSTVHPDKGEYNNIPLKCGKLVPIHPTAREDLGKPLLKAAGEGNLLETKLLLSKGALFTADWLGTSPLHLAAQNNHVEICEILLRAGITKDARTKVDRTPLHVAACEGHIRIVEILLDYNAETNCKDMLGMTPLHWAAQNGHYVVAKALLTSGAEPHLTNKFDLSPVDLATQINRHDIVDLINMSAVMAATTAYQYSATIVDGDSASETIVHPLPFVETILLEGDDDSLIDLETLSSSCTGAIQQRQSTPTNKGLSSNKIKSPFCAPEVTSQNSENAVKNCLNSNAETSSINPSSFDESMKILQEHGITMLPSEDEQDSILSTVMESGHSVVLTDMGKEMLRYVKETDEKRMAIKSMSNPLKKKIITVTPDELIKLTANGRIAKTNVVRKSGGHVVDDDGAAAIAMRTPAGASKRIVMKKDKVLVSPVATATSTTTGKIGTVKDASSMMCGLTDMETVMKQLIDARRTIEEYKMKLSNKEQEVEQYKQQLKLFLEES